MHTACFLLLYESVRYQLNISFLFLSAIRPIFQCITIILIIANIPKGGKSCISQAFCKMAI